ncbi:MAG: N-acetyl-gamma-glutamyl-phosphate reductase [Bacteroidetes bacterium]|nr:N-acetyl-gamma-glutamyl-phosphate reductase [Bacteroidota bacterium]
MKKIKVGVIGGAGYTGGELIRILINHPHAEIAFVYSKSNAGNYLYDVHSDLLGETKQKFSSEWNEDIDVMFLCVGHGEAKKFIDENKIADHIRIIDLSQDFRLLNGENQRTINGKPVVYGLPELNRDKIRKAHHVANPGCFATAIQLGLLPLAKAGLLREVYTTGITGSTGAGQGLSHTTHFSWRANNIQAYKTLTHQHVKEIHQSLHQLQKSFPLSPDDEKGLNFIPWRGDFTRGIFISSLMDSPTKIETLTELYENYYEDHPFTFLNKDSVFLKQVVNTNKCIIQLEKIGSKVAIHSVIDNLVKGASGQAIQNMNLMFGIDECAGLKLKANYF